MSASVVRECNSIESLRSKMSFFCVICSQCACKILQTNKLFCLFDSRWQLRYSRVYLIFRHMIAFNDESSKERLLNVSLKTLSKVLNNCIHLREHFRIKTISFDVTRFVAVSTFTFTWRFLRIVCERLNICVASFLIVKSRRNRRVVELANNDIFLNVASSFFEIAVFERICILIILIILIILVIWIACKENVFYARCSRDESESIEKKFCKRRNRLIDIRSQTHEKMISFLRFNKILQFVL